jgi:predicted dehydrogenase
MMSPLRIGIIGCGGITQMMHLPYMMEYREKFEVVALADVSASVVEAVGERFGIAQRTTDWRALLAREDIDAVGIFHSGSHYETTLAAIQAHKHILVEKPIAWNLRQTQEIAALAQNYDRVIQLAYHKIYDPATAYTKAQVQAMQDLAYARITVLHPADELGRSMHRVRAQDGRIIEGHVDVGTWEQQVNGQVQAFTRGVLETSVDEVLGARKDDERLRLAYAIFAQSIIHQIYMLHEFLGAPERVLHSHIWRDGLSINSLMQYPNDLHVSLDWHFLKDLKDYREEYAFFGNYDRVMMQLPAPYFRNFPSPVIIQGHEGETTWEKRVIVNYDEAFRLELMEFYDAVTEKRAPKTTVQDALAHSRLIQALIDAAN